MAMTVEQQRALALARARLAAQQKQTEGQRVVQSGSILPISRNAAGEVSFDSNAGLLGAAKRAFTLPGEVMRGEVDPMSDEGINRAAEMATAISPASAAARAGERAIPGVSTALRQPDLPAPSAEQLRNAARQGYRDVRESGVDYTGESVANLAAAARQALDEDALFAPLTPKTERLLRPLRNPPEDGFSTIAQVAGARKGFGRAASRRSLEYPEDQVAAQRVRQQFSDFIARPDPESLVDQTPAGLQRAQLAGQLQRESDGNYAAAMRSGTVTDIADEARLRAQAANSGQNLDNTTRQKLVALLLDQRRNAGFSDEELKAIENVSAGSRTTNTLRGVGNFLGGGGGLGMLATFGIGGAAGASAAGPVGAAIGAAVPAALGAAAKRGAASMTSRGLRKVDEQTRRRSPLYERMMADAPLEAINAERRAALVRALMLSEQQ